MSEDSPDGSVRRSRRSVKRPTYTETSEVDEVDDDMSRSSKENDLENADSDDDVKSRSTNTTRTSIVRNSARRKRTRNVHTTSDEEEDDNDDDGEYRDAEQEDDGDDDEAPADDIETVTDDRYEIPTVDPADIALVSSRIGSDPGSVAEAGTIMNIHLHNFMSHKNYRLDFSPHINFIHGRNGSGKSAVLVAIQTLFGAKAHDTQRAHSLGALIRHNAKNKKAIITVALKNKGLGAWRPDEYGEIIRIRRVILPTSSHYLTVTYSHNKKNTTTGEPLEKVKPFKRTLLDELCKHFNIQINNPCVIMSQEQSKKYLRSATIQDKYMFFLKAVGLYELREMTQQSDNNIKLIQIEINKIKDNIRIKREQVSEIKKELEARKDMEQRKNLLKEHIRAEKWRHIYDRSQESKEIEQALVIVKEQLNQKEIEREQAQQQHNEWNTQHDHYQGNVDDTEATYQAKNREYNHQQARLKTNERELNKLKQTNLVNLTKEIENTLNELKEKQYERDNKRDERIRAHDEQRSRLDQDVSKSIAKRDQLNKQLETAKSDISILTQNTQELTDKERAVQQQISQLNRDLTAFRQQLISLDSGAGTRFGPNAKQVDMLIDQRIHTFRRRPLGPLGHFVEIPAEHKQWLTAIEVAVGRVLLSYITDNQQDAQALRKILNEVYGRDRVPVIHTTQYRDRRIFDVNAPNPFQPNQRLIDCLKIENPWIFNLVVDETKCDLTVLMERENDAFDYIKTPAGIRAASVYTVDGTRVSGRSNVRQRQKNQNQRNTIKLGTDNKAERSRLNDLIIQIQQEIPRLESELYQIKSDNTHSSQQLRKLKNDIKNYELNLEKEENNINNLEFEQETLSQNNGNTDALLDEEIDRLTNEYQVLNDRKDVLNLKINNLNIQYSEAQSILERLETEREEAHLAYRQAQTILEQHIISNATNEKLLKKLDLMIKDLNQIIKQRNDYYITLNKQLEIDKNKLIHVEGTSYYNEDLVINHTIPELRKLIEKYTNNIQKFEETLIKSKYNNKNYTIEQFQQKYDIINNEYINLRQEFQPRVDDLNNELKAIDDRKEKWFQYREMFSYQLTKYFNDFLHLQKMTGKLVFDHNAQPPTLTVRVLPRLATNTSSSSSSSSTLSRAMEQEAQMSDTNQLSGGESSYATLSFVMALWQVVESPFRAIDEFDVFQDTMNRKTSLTLLIEAARATLNRQFFFITPLDVSGITVTPFVHVIKLQPPERHQTSINFAQQQAT